MWPLALFSPRAVPDFIENIPQPACCTLGAQKRQDRHRLYSEWAAEFGPVFKIRQVFRWVLVCTDPKIFAEAVRCKELDKGQLIDPPFVKARAP